MNNEINYFECLDNSDYIAYANRPEMYTRDYETLREYARKAEELVNYEKDNSDVIRNSSKEEIQLKIKDIIQDLFEQMLFNYEDMATNNGADVIKLDDRFAELVQEHLGITIDKSRKN